MKGWEKGGSKPKRVEFKALTRKGPVDAWAWEVEPGLGIQRPLRKDGQGQHEGPRDGWVLVHLTSGYTLSNQLFATKPQAMAAARELRGLRWERPAAEVSADEHLKRRVADVLGRAVRMSEPDDPLLRDLKAAVMDTEVGQTLKCGCTIEWDGKCRHGNVSSLTAAGLI